MNAKDVLFYGQKTFTTALEGISDEEAENGFVTRLWNVRDVVAHITAFEHVLEEVLGKELMPTEIDTPYLTQFQDMKGEEFNQYHYEETKTLKYSEVLAELNSAYDHVMTLIVRFTPEMLREVGTLPWYGPEYSLDDFIVYTYYGHKREHAAQIRQYKKHLDALHSLPSKK
jgi:hypothetical protein